MEEENGAQVEKDKELVRIAALRAAACARWW